MDFFKDKQPFGVRQEDRNDDISYPFPDVKLMHLLFSAEGANICLGPLTMVRIPAFFLQPAGSDPSPQFHKNENEQFGVMQSATQTYRGHSSSRPDQDLIKYLGGSAMNYDDKSLVGNEL